MSNINRIHNEYLDPDRHLWNHEPEGPELETDPYGHLSYTIGDDDNFWCFDFAVSDDGQFVKLHAVINSETGSFIMDASEPEVVPAAEAVATAQSLVDAAIDWCIGEGIDDPIEPTEDGNFVADVKAAI